MVQLNRGFIKTSRASEAVELPAPGTLDLPEKVLQFGAGVFLRAFLEDFIQQANNRGDFGGRVVVVQRAPDARSAHADEQDCLYTLWLRGVRGVSGGQLSETRRMIGSISRLLSASTGWSQVLDVARSEELALIISNSTEVGYSTDPGDTLAAAPPPSFPAKLTRVLWERFVHFGGDLARGPLVVPCELLENNAGLLRTVVLEVADRWRLPGQFQQWVEEACTFSSTLVDRIVTGPPSREKMEQEWRLLGYRDEMLIAAEPYYLFAVEDPWGRARAAFPIDDASPGVLFTPDITPYWRRKLRLLNGPHTLLSPQGIFSGCRTVKEAIDRAELRAYLEQTMIEEIVPALGGDESDRTTNEAYARDVIERFSNPFVEHLLANICVNCATKLGVRIFPMVTAYYESQGRLPERMLRGVAAVLRYTRGDFGEVRDPNANFFQQEWSRGGSQEELVRRTLDNAAAWGGHRLEADVFAAPIARYLHEFLGAAVVHRR